MVILLTQYQALWIYICTHCPVYYFSGVTLLFFVTVFRALSLGQMLHLCVVRAMQNDINGSQHGP